VPDYEGVARAAAARAGALLRSRYREPHEVTFKGEVDLVTTTDRDAERLIVDTIREAFPTHGITAEESPMQPGTDAHRWYIDPLDGTTNFAHGYPHFAVSIALAREDEMQVGLVYDPVRDETFSAVRGEGARLNGAAIRVSDTGRLEHALLSTGFPYDRRRHAAFYVAFLAEAMRRSQGVRRAGSAALDLCYVAAGRVDGFWELGLQKWDVAAGALMIREAGGRISDFRGTDGYLASGNVVAGNPKVYAALSKLLAPFTAGVE